jgi:hypothetical protein
MLPDKTQLHRGAHTMEPDLTLYDLYKAQHQDLVHTAEATRKLSFNMQDESGSRAASGSATSYGARALARISAIAAMLATLTVGW